MKAYLLTTGSLFGLITIVHVWRMVVEAGVATRDPWIILMTVLSAALCVWAGRLFMTSRNAP
jgi:hypothetical protein